MGTVIEYLGRFYRFLKNKTFYVKHRGFIKGFFNEHGFDQIKTFNLAKWHHDLYLFTARDESGGLVFIKMTNLPRILKNENRAYKKLKKDNFLSQHLIEHKGYIKKGSYKALILKKAKGVVLSEQWAMENVNKLSSLIKIVDEFTKLNLIHRDIKLDNFIFENGIIKIFDFSFMIDKAENRRIKEIDLSKNENMMKLVTMGEGYKPAPLHWDDYYALYIVFSNLLRNKGNVLSLEKKEVLQGYINECSEKIGSNNYILVE